MSLYPAGYPWLSKPQVMLEAGSMIADSTAKARGLIGYLDFANGQDGNGNGPPFWRPPHGQTDFWRVKESHLQWPQYLAPEDNLRRVRVPGADAPRAAGRDVRVHPLRLPEHALPGCLVADRRAPWSSCRS